LFDGQIAPGAEYFLVDDHFGMGGTLANLRGYVEASGARVTGATTLTASRGNDILALSAATRAELAARYEQGLESYLQTEFGFGADCLTEPEAGYLGRAQTLDAIRGRIFAAKGQGG
jgi:hypothetical protein